MNKKNKNKKAQEQPLDEYLKRLKTDKPTYYVKDTAEGNESDVEILFILESPHKEEVKEGKPLMGNSGIDVSKFLGLRNNKEAFGKQVNEISKLKIGIMNVSNIPLQVLKETETNTNYQDADGIRQNLNSIRDLEKINPTLLNFFCEKIRKYINVKKFVLCGAFACRYFDEYITCSKQTEILKKIYKEDIEILKVPHPSYGHWQFIDKHKANLERLKELFSEVNEK